MCDIFENFNNICGLVIALVEHFNDVVFCNINDELCN